MDCTFKISAPSDARIDGKNWEDTPLGVHKIDESSGWQGRGERSNKKSLFSPGDIEQDYSYVIQAMKSLDEDDAPFLAVGLAPGA